MARSSLDRPRPEGETVPEDRLGPRPSDEADTENYLEFKAEDFRCLNCAAENEIIFGALTDVSGNLSGPVPPIGSLYSIPFSLQRDFIPFWNADSKDIELCLGFDDGMPEFEERISKINREECKLCECTYLEESDFIRKIAGVKRRFSEGEESIESTMVQCSSCRLDWFEYERGYRLSVYVSPDAGAREGMFRTALKRRVKIPVALLKEVIVSPYAKDSECIKYGLEGFLYRKYFGMGIYGVGIRVGTSWQELR